MDKNIEREKTTAAVTAATTILKDAGLTDFIIMAGQQPTDNSDKMEIVISIKGSTSALANIIFQGPPMVLSQLREQDPVTVTMIEMAAIEKLAQDLDFATGSFVNSGSHHNKNKEGNC